MTADQISFRIVRCVNYEAGTNWNYKVNLYPFNTLYFVIAGDGHICVSNKITDLFPGYTYLIPANTLFSCWCDSHIQKIYADVHAEVVPGYDIFSSISEVMVVPFPLEEMIKFLEAVKVTNLKNALYVKGEVIKAVSMFMNDSFQIPDKDILKYKEILDDIEQNLSCELRVSDIALKHGYNAVVLTRNFKKVFGYGLKAYIERLLLSNIKQCLITSDKTINELAAEYRFCDQYYLSKFFKKYEKCSPIEYRKHNQDR